MDDKLMEQCRREFERRVKQAAFVALPALSWVRAFQAEPAGGPPGRAKFRRSGQKRASGPKTARVGRPLMRYSPKGG